MIAAEARTKLHALATPEEATASVRFFKTWPGQYGEGDRFIGVRIPTIRTVARQFRALPPDEIEALLNSPVHEERHLALLVLVLQAAKGDGARRKAAFDLYLPNTRFVNNWDLVDCSAAPVVGGFLLDRSRKPLHKLAKSTSLWERRIAVVSTQHIIRHDDFDDTLAISRMLLDDDEDLIHKAAAATRLGSPRCSSRCGGDTHPPPRTLLGCRTAG